MSLQEKSMKWMTNKQELNFTATVTFVEKSLSFKVEKAPKKYLVAIRRLATELISEAINEMADMFSFSVAPEDSEKESKKIKDFMLLRREPLLNLLLSDGYDAFSAAVAKDVTMLKLQYDVRSMVYTKCGWTKWDGAELHEDGWHDKNGNVYEDEVSQIFAKTLV